MNILDTGYEKFLKSRIEGRGILNETYILIFLRQLCTCNQSSIFIFSKKEYVSPHVYQNIYSKYNGVTMTEAHYDISLKKTFL